MRPDAGLKNTAFSKFARRVNFDDSALCKVIASAALKELASEILNYDDRAIDKVVADGILTEVNCDG